MKIAIRKSDNIVVFIGEELTLTATGVQGKDFVYNGESPDNFLIETVTALPENFIGNGFTYTNGVFTPNAQGIAHNERMTAKAQADAIALIATKWSNVRARQKSMIETSNAGWRCARYQTQLPLNCRTDTEATYIEMLNWLQSIRNCDDKNYATPELAMAALDALPAEPL